MKTVASLVVLLMLVCSQIAHGQPYPEADPNDTRYDPICFVGYTNSLQPWLPSPNNQAHLYHCGGVLIAPSTVITAEHCLVRNPDDSIAPHTVAFRRHPDGTLASPPDVATYYNIPVLSYDVSPNSADLVILHLDPAFSTGHITPMLIHQDPNGIQVGDDLIALSVGPHNERGRIRRFDTTLDEQIWKAFIDPNTLEIQHQRHMIDTGNHGIIGDSGGAIVIEVPDIQSSGPRGNSPRSVPTRFELVATMVQGGNTPTLSDVVLMHPTIMPDYLCYYEDTFGLPVPCPADLNRDHVINGADYTYFLSQMGSCACDSVCDFIDSDDDGDVDGDDLNVYLPLMMANLGTCPCPTSCDSSGVSGDLDGDGCVNSMDYSLWFDYRNNPHPGCDPCLDLNDDGDVDEDDDKMFFDILVNSNC